MTRPRVNDKICAVKIFDTLEVAPGEVLAVGGEPSDCTRWLSRLAADDGLEGSVAFLGFSQHSGIARATGWPQARYYTDEGRTVGECLSYNEVYEINPFEIGAKRPETRKAFAARRERLLRLLDLRRLVHSPLIALSNGETRRFLLARALAKGPRLLALDDPAAGLDSRQREKLKALIAALARRGVAVLAACRHADELPSCLAGVVKVGADGVAKRADLGALKPAAGPVRRTASTPGGPGRVRKPRAASAPPVVEMRDVDISFGSRRLFRGFSWTVRKGERWLLRGANGSGKTTLFALITGDSPLAYAADVKVFGVPRETGRDLSGVRRRIATASPEQQAYLGKSPGELLDAALSSLADLLLLDEPFMNMSPREAKAAARRIAACLKARPDVTAIMICHRDDEAPAVFSRVMDLDALAKGEGGEWTT